MGLSTGFLSLTHKTGLTADLAAQLAQSKIIKGGMYHDTEIGVLKYGLDETHYFEFAAKNDIPNLAFNDGGTVDFIRNGSQITAEVKKSAQANNAIVLNSDGVYVAPAPAQTPDFILSVIGTPTAELTRNPAGQLKADVKITDTASSDNALRILNDGLFVPKPTAGITESSLTYEIVEEDDTYYHNLIVNVAPGTDNALTKVVDGLKVKKLTVAPSSLGLLSINANNEINIEKKATVEVIISTQNSLANFIANDAQAITMASGDYVYLPNATDKKQSGWIHTGAGGTLGTSSFVPVEFPDYTDTQIRALLSAGQGLVYNPSTGLIAAKISTQVGNDLSFSVLDNGLFVDVATSPLAFTVKGAATTITVEQAIAELYNRTYDVVNGLNSNYSALTGTTTFELGGYLTKNTIVDGNGVHNLSLLNLVNFSSFASGFTSILSDSGTTIGTSTTPMNFTDDGFCDLTGNFSATGEIVAMNGDIVIANSTKRLSLKSDNGTTWFFGVNNNGQLYNAGANLR
jgi:hypothetical protein